GGRAVCKLLVAADLPGADRGADLLCGARVSGVCMNAVKTADPMTTTHRTIAWIGDTDGFIRLIDQTLLPTQIEYRDFHAVEEIWEAIRSLRVRGAPAIGVAAAMGVVLGMQKMPDRRHGSFTRRLREVTDFLRTSRPTAVNLFWALDRMATHIRPHLEK